MIDFVISDWFSSAVAIINMGVNFYEFNSIKNISIDSRNHIVEETSIVWSKKVVLFWIWIFLDKYQNVHTISKYIFCVNSWNHFKVNYQNTLYNDSMGKMYIATIIKLYWIEWANFTYFKNNNLNTWRHILCVHKHEL